MHMRWFSHLRKPILTWPKLISSTPKKGRPQQFLQVLWSSSQHLLCLQARFPKRLESSAPFPFIPPHDLINALRRIAGRRTEDQRNVPHFLLFHFPVLVTRNSGQRSQSVVPITAAKMHVFEFKIVNDFAMRHDEVRDLYS